MIAEFEEKSYEIAANGELRLSTTDMFAPGQVAEGILGIDLAATPPAANPLWGMINGGTPPGLLLTPNLWATAGQLPPDVRLPSFIVSLLLQYKRPEHMVRASAAQFGHWRRPYFRFGVDPRQQGILFRLESKLVGNALIRYAAPAFHTFTELELTLRNQKVLTGTGFVSPNSLAGHEVWTYTGPGDVGWANPDGDHAPFASWSEVREAMDLRQSKRTVLQHLRHLASAVSQTMGLENVAPPKDLRVKDREIVDPDLKQGFADLVTVGAMTGRFGMSWWISVRSQ